MDLVRVDSRKWPDSRHWQFSMERLGEDRHGVWLYAPSETVARRGREPPRTLGVGFVGLVPRDSWWMAEFYWDHPRHSVYVNIGTPCRWGDEGFTQVDLDLDVVRKVDGSVEVLDEHEFVEHQEKLGYPADLVAGARVAAAEVVEMLTNQIEPFGTAASPWLEGVERR